MLPKCVTSILPEQDFPDKGMSRIWKVGGKRLKQPKVAKRAICVNRRFDASMGRMGKAWRKRMKQPKVAKRAICVKRRFDASIGGD
jgi:hypothetical protein